MTLGYEAARIDPMLRNEVLSRRRGASVGKVLIVFDGAHAVGVAVDRESYFLDNLDGRQPPRQVLR